MAETVVRTLVHRPAVDVPPETTLRALAETLSEESVGVVVVRGPHPSGRGTTARGLVSERDVVQAIAEGMDPDPSRAEDVMTGDLASVRPDETVRDAAAQMLANEIRHLPVMDGDTVVGVISMRDVLDEVVAASAGPPRI